MTIWTSGPSILLHNYFHFSRRSWQFFWCDFSFVIRKVRDSAARRLKRGRKKKPLWEGARGEDSEKNHCLLPSPPPPSFSVSTLVQHSRGWNFYFANRKRNTRQKLPATQAISTRLTLWNCLFEIYDGSKYAVVKGGFRAGGDVQGDTWRPQSGSNSFLFIISV